MPFWNKKSGDASSALDLAVEEKLQTATVTCPKCKWVYTGREAFEHLYICPECGKYMPIGAKERLVMVLDEGRFEPWFEDVLTGNPLHTADYEDKIASIQKKSGCSEAVTIGKGKISGYETVIGVCDPNFMMGSMGQAMGERITRAFEKATRLRLPVILFCCSGGARMQEGIISLMQMEKTGDKCGKILLRQTTP